MPSDKEKAICKKKRRFASEAEAKQSLKTIRKHKSWFSRGGPNRVYKCTVCFGYHLTSSKRK